MSRKRRNNETPSRVMFVMDMCNQPVPSIEAYEAEFQTAGPDLLRDAGRIERDFIPWYLAPAGRDHRHAGQRPSSPLDPVLEERNNGVRAAAGWPPGYEYARHWARFQHAVMPNGTAEDQLEGYLNQALADAMDSDKWQCPLEIAALYPPPRPMPASDPDDDIPRWAESIGIESDARYVRMAEKAIPKLSSLAAVNPVRA